MSASLPPDPLHCPPPTPRTDPRDAKAGAVVSDLNGYYDSQNIVSVGTPPVYSVILHHSHNREGGAGLRLYSTRSLDRGRTWSPLVPIEDSLTRQSHDGYQLVHTLPDGTERIYLFFGYNQGEDRYLDARGETVELLRSDMQLEEGYYFRYSDDQAQSWSPRHPIPVRRTRIDRDNPWGGRVMGMFMCDKPSVIHGAVYFAFQKTRDGAGETPGSEVFFLRSPDLLTVDDPAEASWQTLPLGEDGLQAPSGTLQLGEEPHILPVSDRDPQRVFCLWRTEVGRLAASYSSDGGAHWDTPHWLNYPGRPTSGRAPSADQEELRNPRGAITPIRLAQRTPDGRSVFALLFYNNGHTERLGYCGRRVMWLTVGHETPAKTIRWSQPEVALWWDGLFLDSRDDWNADWAIVDGAGYADWLEEDGQLSFVASNKLAVRYHRVEPRTLWHLRHQQALRHLPAHGLVMHHCSPAPGTHIRGPVLPDLRSGGGFTLVVEVSGVRDSVKHGQVLLSGLQEVTAALDDEPTDETITKGFELAVTAEGALALTITNGFGVSTTWQTTLAHPHALWDGAPHTVGFIVDGGPKVISVVVDEKLCDGGASHPQGWAFLARELGEIGGSAVCVAPDFAGALRRVLLYERALLTSEVIAIHRQGASAPSASDP